jgi:adenine/guanine phosphoribosyltransferase-like PRPP-binding protein
VDDLLATGWTAMAAIQLVEKLWWCIHHAAFVIWLDEAFLVWQVSRQKLSEYSCSSVVHYDE